MHIVGHQHRGEAVAAPQVFDQLLHVQACQRIERAQRFVQQQQPGPMQQRAGERHALLLAARQRRRPFAAALAQADLPQHGGRPATLALRQADGDVVDYPLPWQQPRVLEHDAHAFIGAGLRHSVEAHGRVGLRLAARGRRRFQARQQAQQRALAATAAAHHGHELARGDIQVQPFQDMPFAIVFVQIAQSHSHRRLGGRDSRRLVCRLGAARLQVLQELEFAEIDKHVPLPNKHRRRKARATRLEGCVSGPPVGRVPGQQALLQPARAQVGQLAQQRVQQDAQQHHIGLQEFARVHGHVPDARLRRNGLGHDENDPHQPQREAQPDQHGRQGARQDDVAVQAPARQPVRTSHFDQRRIDRADAVERVQVHGKKHAQCQQRQLGGLFDAEPQDHQRNQRQHRNVAHHLQRGVEQTFGQPRCAVEQAQRQAQAASQQQPPQGPQGAHTQVFPEFAGKGQAPAGARHGPGRRQHAGR
ncbi:hypothetical protein predicted by Glimmer/Critica [Bordetella petrii]|uniref:Uncharacterized protein n=1 Tax=Bordetella petrii (strain ATCC BAA-461 / DSM 12804 / CCUG 43448 / CIP 107267 / Se-1111R) TaxID=340100 RepID=A9IMT1_BORPD|nr:hypothetical protein predicted by Glimmer/Critica [Bordetella petrii]